MEEKRGILEANSLWYKYKTRVWLQKTSQKAVVHNVMRVLRSMRNLSHLAYVSTPITTSRYLYELKLTHPLMKKNAQIKRAIDHNYYLGWSFVGELKKRRDCPILYPADLIPVDQQWEQAHFQALWLSIIAEKCTELHMAEEWEYSNGSFEEFTHTMQLKLGLPKHRNLVFFNTKEEEETERERMRNIQIYDHQGTPISLNDGIRAIESALSWLRNHGFDPERLENCLHLLRWTGNMISRGFYQ